MLLYVYTHAGEAHSKGLSKRQARKEFGIPKFMLQRYLNKLTIDQKSAIEYVQRRKVYNVEMENDLAQYCTNLKRVHHWVSSKR